MSYLRRKTDIYLENWKKNPDRLPLIIKGARQIGKTETIRRFAGKNYKYVNEINFVTDPMYKSIVEEGFSAASIVKIISRIDPGKKFIEGETLLFFDEIQEFPEIATSLKFFKEDGKYDVICSGSLLGVQYHRIASISVGAKTDYPMHSMDFEEFLWAKGYGDDLIEDMIIHMLEGSPFSEAEHKILSNLFLEFCILGGMPAVISNYIEKGTFEGSLNMQRQLLVDYSNDIIKYAEGLDKAKILSVCNCLGFPELPLKGNVDEAKFKVYMTDTGLLVASLDDEAIPIEVKSNTNRSKSLRQLINSDSYPDIKHGIKFTVGNVGISDDVVSFPYFCLFLLKRYLERQEIFE